jgi:hypothetical protein
MWMANARVRWVLLGLVAVLGLAACGGESNGGSAEAVVTGPTTKTERESLGLSAADRPPAADIGGTTLTGEPIALVDLRGRPVFVKVFGGY